MCKLANRERSQFKDGYSEKGSRISECFITRRPQKVPDKEPAVFLVLPHHFIFAFGYGKIIIRNYGVFLTQLIHILSAPRWKTDEF